MKCRESGVCHRNIAAFCYNQIIEKSISLNVHVTYLLAPKIPAPFKFLTTEDIESLLEGFF